MKNTLKCFGCGEEFLRDNLISYASPGTKAFHNYCSKCYDEKISRDKFSSTVCRVFGILSPGPRIWTERKRLKNKYSFSDDLIIECLDYLYNVEHKKKLAESICLVNAESINRMLRYKEAREIEENNIKQENATNLKNHVVSINEKKNNEKEILNIDDFLDD